MNDNSECANLPPGKPGKGRHGPRRIPDTRHDAETRASATSMFVAGMRPGAVSMTLGVKFQTVYSWWAKWKRDAARECVVSSDADPGQGEEV